MTARILPHVGRFIPRQRRFQIDQQAGRSLSIDLIVADDAQCVVGSAQPVFRLDLKKFGWNVDVYSKIDANFPNGTTEIQKGPGAVTTRVTDHDAVAPAKDHFVKSQILEMAAVGQVDIGIIRIRQAERFGEQRTHRNAWAGLVKRVTAGRSRIAKPPPQPDVKEREQKRHCRSRVVTHVGTSRSSGNGHGGSEGHGSVEPAIRSIQLRTSVSEIPTSAKEWGSRE